MRDIVSQPGLVQALRAEMEEVLARHSGAITTKALYEMKLLDSVMKESQRMHMLGPGKTLPSPNPLFPSPYPHPIIYHSNPQV